MHNKRKHPTRYAPGCCGRYAELDMDWINEAKRIFRIEKPEHFTNYTHCEECEEHDQTLNRSTIDSIGLDELGNPGWNPICFSSVEGKKYYMPSFIRLSLETMHSEFYLGQLLSCLEGDGKENKLYCACNAEQRSFITDFIEYIILHHTEQLEANGCEMEALKVQGIWSNA
ncbi:DUF6714 family protein [Simiduia aestuariiviva]|uniref:Uncharacterized protein n=1 Tax=Simiduia aestuariiviva TaxID=1510459 RepID=A0A839UJ89_9GAMM|nr:DUF6714 family protein [Simiduia aestuariiviva]MBB3166831.1 hypothetical protein [Simiduia aestuariiviva]